MNAYDRHPRTNYQDHYLPVDQVPGGGVMQIKTTEKEMEFFEAVRDSYLAKGEHVFADFIRVYVLNHRRDTNHYIELKEKQKQHYIKLMAEQQAKLQFGEKK